MSAASRYKASAPQRERRRVAEELAGRLNLPVTQTDGTPGFDRDVVAMLDGGTFDVARANEHALSLIRRDAPNVYDQRRVDLGLAIQRALKGQPSECQECGGKGGGMSCEIFGGVVGDVWWDTCHDCHGSGHNLRGVLPPVEWSAQVRRRRQDAEAHRTRRTGNDIHTYGWNDWINESEIHGGVMWHGEMTETCYGDPGWTRVAPRGTHRDDIDRARTIDMTVDQRINARGWDTWDDELKTEALPYGHQGPRNRIGWLFDARPRWRRGELRHAEQRAAKLLRGQS